MRVQQYQIINKLRSLTMKNIIVMGSILALLLTPSYGVAQMNTGHGGGMMDGGWGWGMGYGWGFGIIITILVILVVVFMMKRR